MNDIGIIVLGGKRGGFAIVDIEWFPYVNSMKWYLGSRGYPKTGLWDKERQRSIGMDLHTLVADVAAGVPVDHKNGFTIDNTQRNLRAASQKTNAWNRGKQRTRNGRPPLSRFKGVTLQHGKWRALISYGGMQIILGRFDNEEDAALAYNRAAIQHFGQFARLNQL